VKRHAVIGCQRPVVNATPAGQDGTICHKRNQPARGQLGAQGLRIFVHRSMLPHLSVRIGGISQGRSDHRRQILKKQFRRLPAENASPLSRQSDGKTCFDGAVAVELDRGLGEDFLTGALNLDPATLPGATARRGLPCFPGKTARQQGCHPNSPAPVGIGFFGEIRNRWGKDRPDATGRGKGIPLDVVNVERKCGKRPLTDDITIGFVAAAINAEQGSAQLFVIHGGNFHKKNRPVPHDSASTGLL
jgi:hypothetical protein